jgi:hypothetical protein
MGAAVFLLVFMCCPPEGATTRQIAAAVGRRLHSNPRVAWRHALGLTQQEVATAYNQRWPGQSPKTGKDISYWERWAGPGSTPTSSARAPTALGLSRLATLYGCTVDDLLGTDTRDDELLGRPTRAAAPGYAESRPSTSGPPAPVHHPEEDDTNRREMLASMTATGLTLAGVPLPGRLPTPDTITPDRIEQVRRLTETYRSWVYQHGASGQLQRSVTQLLDHATGMISRASDPAQRMALLDATADVANLAAYACRDLGLHADAQQNYLLSSKPRKQPEIKHSPATPWSAWPGTRSNSPSPSKCSAS